MPVVSSTVSLAARNNVDARDFLLQDSSLHRAELRISHIGGQ